MANRFPVCIQWPPEIPPEAVADDVRFGICWYANKYELREGVKRAADIYTAQLVDYAVTEFFQHSYLSITHCKLSRLF